MQASKMRLGQCPFCHARTAQDDLGLYHEQPTCEQWQAKMAELPVRYVGQVNALVLEVVEPDPKDSN